MGRTVSELSAILTVDELAHWLAFNQRFPIGDEREDYLFANLCANLVASSGAKRKGGGTFSLSDFLMFKQPEKPKSVLEFMTALLGNRLVKGKPK